MMIFSRQVPSIGRLAFLCFLLSSSSKAARLDDNPLPAQPPWKVVANQSPGMFGAAVSSAGDVNGDGYGDVIVGAPNFTNGEAGEGKVFVYLGSSSGLSKVASWAVESNLVGAKFGISLASADVNGDGYGDVIVGAPGALNGAGGAFGGVYVFHGSPTGLGASADWIVNGLQRGASFGSAVASAGDVDGNGFDDLIVGARNQSNGQFREGAVFVFMGSAQGLGASPSWSGESDQDSARFGAAVASAGDVNGDGFADVVIGAPQFDNGEADEGRAFVYHGSITGLGLSPAPYSSYSSTLRLRTVVTLLLAEEFDQVVFKIR